MSKSTSTTRYDHVPGIVPVAFGKCCGAAENKSFRARIASCEDSLHGMPDESTTICAAGAWLNDASKQATTSPIDVSSLSGQANQAAYYHWPKVRCTSAQGKVTTYGSYELAQLLKSKNIVDQTSGPLLDCSVYSF
jgi:hypothetical protein